MLSIDNGPEFIFKALAAWAHRHGVRLEFSRPGKPTDNAFIEAFNRRFRDECLNLHWFDSLEEAQATIEAWRVDYNTERPHVALGQQTPAAFSQSCQPPRRRSRTNPTGGSGNGCGPGRVPTLHQAGRLLGRSQRQSPPAIRTKPTPTCDHKPKPTSQLTPKARRMETDRDGPDARVHTLYPIDLGGNPQESRPHLASRTA